MTDTSTRQRVHRVIRVDQAGEYGARRIYEGQLAVLGVNHPLYATIKAMADNEQTHLDRFDTLMTEQHVRPTLLAPFWHVAGFALGAATALVGPKVAMACTDAVETEIDAHYAAQHADLEGDAPDLAATIESFRQDEVRHRDVARAHDAQSAPAYPLLSGAIRLGCRLAIRLAERL